MGKVAFFVYFEQYHAVPPCSLATVPFHPTPPRAVTLSATRRRPVPPTAACRGPAPSNAAGEDPPATRHRPTPRRTAAGRRAPVRRRALSCGPPHCIPRATMVDATKSGGMPACAMHQRRKNPPTKTKAHAKTATRADTRLPNASHAPGATRPKRHDGAPERRSEVARHETLHGKACRLASAQGRNAERRKHCQLARNRRHVGLLHPPQRGGEFLARAGQHARARQKRGSRTTAPTPRTAAAATATAHSGTAGMLARNNPV